MKWCRLAADQGNAEAQDMLGTMYDHSEGVAKNYSEAVKWYHRAADQGNADAQSHLGLMYAAGEGVRGITSVHTSGSTCRPRGATTLQ